MKYNYSLISPFQFQDLVIHVLNCLVWLPKPSLKGMMVAETLVLMVKLYYSESDGHSYKKILCIGYDISILLTHSSSKFIRFLYHDGGL